MSPDQVAFRANSPFYGCEAISLRGKVAFLALEKHERRSENKIKNKFYFTKRSSFSKFPPICLENFKEE
jgi:hypothetical protein